MQTVQCLPSYLVIFRSIVSIVEQQLNTTSEIRVSSPNRFLANVFFFIVKVAQQSAMRLLATSQLPAVDGTRSCQLPAVVGTRSCQLPAVVGTRSCQLPAVVGTRSCQLPAVVGTRSCQLPAVAGDAGTDRAGPRQSRPSPGHRPGRPRRNAEPKGAPPPPPDRKWTRRRPWLGEEFGGSNGRGGRLGARGYSVI